MATRSLLPVHSTILAEGLATALAVLATSLLVFQEEFTNKGVLVAWYAIDRADWQAGQAAAS